MEKQAPDAELSNSSTKFSVDPKKRLLRAMNHEDYGDAKAPPGMPQAQRGPVVFNRKRKGPKLPPSIKPKP